MKQQTAHQPHGFAVFFATEMWERYGFYVIQGLMILYLTAYFKLSDVQSYAILGSFTALAYCTPLIGGHLADKILGYRHAVICGGILLCIGYAVIAVSKTLPPMYLSLGMITMGTGLLKPNVSAFLGTMYQKNDTRRENGFTLFYVGINLGIILATFASGYIARYAGWHNSFASASAGLVMGVLIFAYGTNSYKIKDTRFSKPARNSQIIWAYIAITCMVLINTALIHFIVIANIFFLFLSVLAIGLVLAHIGRETGKDRRRIIAYLLMLTMSVVFWAIYFQMFFSLNLFVQRAVDHHLLGLNVPTPVFLGIESIGVITFGPILGRLWQHLKSLQRGPSTPTKFSLGLIFMTLSLALLLLGTLLTPLGHLLSPSWLIAAYLLLSIGDLSLSAIGLSMVTELIPPKLTGLMMGIWFVSLGVGGKLAGLFADWSAIPHGVNKLSKIEPVYYHAFARYAVLGFIASVIAVALTPFIKRLISHEDPEQDTDTATNILEASSSKVA